VLKTARTWHPLGIPAYTDLSKLDLGTLKNLALQRVRLERHWRSLKPNDFGFDPVTICLGAGKHEILFFIPGSDAIVIHSPLSEKATCFNFKTKKPLGSEITIGPRIQYISQPYELAGLYKIAILTRYVQ
jgi:hypothetical protein